ncbi:hypothetical protein XaavBphi31_10 [Xanthomonas phage Xaa_vB_phi31]|uniref:Uncharacterized protein n=1 Tax=Xanthomonas phage Xaa_vB_phi31 TaxID=2776752 RepID=A0A868BZG5_9CAUD|nr:hypothetical protein XaavBphi31_10 [Xanthomonas phage Xaa_vB_phi31]
MAQVTVKYKRNRETRTDGIKAWRVDRTFVVQRTACLVRTGQCRCTG